MKLGRLDYCRTVKGGWKWVRDELEGDEEDDETGKGQSMGGLNMEFEK